MAAYLVAVRRMEQHFLGMRFKHIPRLDNHDADDIAKKAATREPLPPGVFEERLTEPSVKIEEQKEDILTQDSERLEAGKAAAGPPTPPRLLMTVPCYP